MKAYKGMDKNMQCLGYQYEIGKTYIHDGPVKCCPDDDDVAQGRGGFHACEYPLDVLSYYPPSESRYFEVEQDGEIESAGGDTKRASTKITIGAELSIAGLVKAAVEYTREHRTQNEEDRATGNQGAASATGDWGAASATGDWGAASATGNQGAASATGNQGAASATGYRGAASATGDWGAASATGDWGAASATGIFGVAVVTGANGTATVSGRASIAVAAGYNSNAKGDIGEAICAIEYDEWDGEKYPIKAVKAAIVDGVTIKANTPYTLKDGELVEVA